MGRATTRFLQAHCGETHLSQASQVMGFGNTRKKERVIARLQTRVNALMCLYPSYKVPLFPGAKLRYAAAMQDCLKT